FSAGAWEITALVETVPVLLTAAPGERVFLVVLESAFLPRAGFSVLWGEREPVLGTSGAAWKAWLPWLGWVPAEVPEVPAEAPGPAPPKREKKSKAGITRTNEIGYVIWASPLGLH